jgi:hypothetical protein
LKAARITSVSLSWVSRITGRGMSRFITARFSSVSREGDSVSIRITSGLIDSICAVRSSAEGSTAATW